MKKLLVIGVLLLSGCFVQQPQQSAPPREHNRVIIHEKERVVTPVPVVPPVVVPVVPVVPVHPRPMPPPPHHGSGIRIEINK